VVGTLVRGSRAGAGERLMATSDGSGLTTQVDPAWLDADSYVAFLNRVFPGQWNRAAYEWYVARPFNYRKSHTLVRVNGTAIVSGMALCYRQVKVGQGPPIQISVISAAGTLPSERRQGHYATLLSSALEHCGDSGSVAALGFVTRQNASGRGLARLGAEAIPSFYITSASRRSGLQQVLRVNRSTTIRSAGTEVNISEAFAMRAQQQCERRGPENSPVAHFHYENTDDWKRQFIHRPRAVRALRLGHDSMALTETVGETDRLQWLCCPGEKVTRYIADLARTSAVRGRGFFMYTLSACEAAAARRAGLRIREGHLMLLPTGRSAADWERLRRAAWQVESGDRL
jgi:hypothetical protein